MTFLEEVQQLREDAALAPEGPYREGFLDAIDQVLELAEEYS